MSPEGIRSSSLGVKRKGWCGNGDSRRHSSQPTILNQQNHPACTCPLFPRPSTPPPQHTHPQTNASIVRDLAQACAEHCPKAHLAIIANPVNSTVPICAEVYKKAGVYDPKRLFGVTTLDVCRSSTFVAGLTGKDPKDVNVTVVGGHSGITIVPLLSQQSDAAGILKEGGQKVADLIKRIQFGGDEVVKAKDGERGVSLTSIHSLGGVHRWECCAGVPWHDRTTTRLHSIACKNRLFTSAKNFKLTSSPTRPLSPTQLSLFQQVPARLRSPWPTLVLSSPTPFSGP